MGARIKLETDTANGSGEGGQHEHEGDRGDHRSREGVRFPFAGAGR